VRSIEPLDDLLVIPGSALRADRRPRGKDRLRAFTAIGIVKEGEPCRAEMSGGFSPFRRDVAWQTAKETPIEPLLEQLEFTSDKRNWGYQLRFGLSLPRNTRLSSMVTNG
jgi:hypothetical protein